MEPHFSPGLARFSKMVPAATLLLMLLGGMVTSLDAGLSVPDWPTTYGYNLFTFPVSQWVGPVFWEHTHRLVASLVGALTCILALWIWLADRRNGVRWLAVGAVALVIVQGVLGGMRVVALSVPLAILHGCTAQAFLCVVTLLAMSLSRNWSIPHPNLPRPPLRSMARWAGILTVVIYTQVILGAVMRYLKAGLAIPTFPLTPEGTLFPRSHNAFVDLAMTHRLWAVVVAGIAALLVFKAVRLVQRGVMPNYFLGYSVVITSLLLLQWTLGAWVIWFQRPPVPTTLHVLNGALLLITAFTLMVGARRLGNPPATTSR